MVKKKVKYCFGEIEEVNLDPDFGGDNYWEKLEDKVRLEKEKEKLIKRGFKRENKTTN